VIPTLERRGFGYGSGMISPNQLIFVVDIPKNASSFVSAWTSQHGWQVGAAHNHEHRVAEMIVVLRDPLDRWISGIAQYLNGWILHAKSFYNLAHGPLEHQQHLDADSFIAHYNPIVERLIFDNLERYDDHVWPQSEIMENVMPDKPRRFFYITENWEHKLATHLGIPMPQDVDRNQGLHNPDLHKLQKFFRERINSDPNLEKMIIDRYDQDYKLIKAVVK
jgi:hypothetical protein